MTLSTTRSSQLTRFHLPGFRLPLNFAPHAPFNTQNKDSHMSEEQGSTAIEVPALGEGAPLFPTALSGKDIDDGYVALPLTTLREFTMLQLMNQLTDKPHWETMIFEEIFVLKWTTEALTAEDIDIAPTMVEWCIAELRYKAKIYKETGAISVYTGDVVKSDIAVSSELKEALRAAVTPLENIPSVDQDWHPNSGNKVLDLVHPSLFPVVYGLTRILPDSLLSLDDCIKRCGEGVVLPRRPTTETGFLDAAGTPKPMDYCSNPFSCKFQWLPCDVEFADDGSTRITSYINNLHPEKHRDLYRVLEKIITCAVPLWNMTLTPLQAPHYRWKRIPYTKCQYFTHLEQPQQEDDEDDEDFEERQAQWEDEQPQQEDDEDDEEFEQRKAQWEEDMGTERVLRPEPGEFTLPKVPEHMRDDYFETGSETLKREKTVDLRRDFGKRGLQIIVKLANIQLTPENPDYDGGVWHVEGQMVSVLFFYAHPSFSHHTFDIHICASALYYYDSKNITESRLAFRQQCNVDDARNVSAEQHQHDWLTEIFGCENEGPAVQEIGTVLTSEGRLITFPNILQHRVGPFKLDDPSKPGHRKILALFLVDPHIRIISAANVPAQQRHWWGETVPLENVPLEVKMKIIADVEGFPIGIEEAKKLRLELMEEREEFVESNGEAFLSPWFGLCEH